MNLPPVVSEAEWQAARDALVAKEKDATRARDALAAERRRLPRLRVEKDYVFDGPDGKVTLRDCSKTAGNCCSTISCSEPSQDVGCPGCSMFVDQIGHLAHLHARDTSFVLVVARSDRENRRLRGTHGLDDPVGTRRSRATSTSTSASDQKARRRASTRTARRSASASSFATATDVFRTYFTTQRGAETLGSVWTFLDLTPLGRQEDWEDSPHGYPQTKPYEWWRRHDEYEKA